MRLQEASRRSVLALFAFSLRAQDAEVSDDSIYDQVNRQLITDRDLGAHPLTVHVEQGIVTVTGFVESEKARKKVDKLVRKVKGVKDVVNRTQVRTDL
ncbi:MAG: BON domain-containing protein [Bryobacterales bacterium]